MSLFSIRDDANAAAGYGCCFYRANWIERVRPVQLELQDDDGSLVSFVGPFVRSLHACTLREKLFDV